MGETDLVAYIDESRKPVRDPKTGRVAGNGSHYVVAAAVVLAVDATHVRKMLQTLADELTSARPLRWTDMSAARRRRTIEVITANNDWEYCLYETSKPVADRQGPDAWVRAHTLSAAFEDLSTARGVVRAILETRSQPVQGFTTHDERDHRLLASMLTKGTAAENFRIEHRGKEEPVLWLADILAGVRTDYLCWVDRETFPVLAHRALTVVAAL